MDFIIQYNMLSNNLLTRIKEAVEPFPHKFVGLIPFSREITSDDPIVGVDHIPYGSTSFVATAHSLKWKGLSFGVEQFSYDTACRNRSDMLNDEQILSISETIKFLEWLPNKKKIFMRPANDLKEFSGSLFSVEEAKSLLMTMDSSIKIVTATTKNILAEWRWFIVGGEVVDGSIYQRDGNKFSAHVVDVDMMRTVQTMADIWLPAPCCVMDTALLDGREMKVVEFNCINGSGFYDHNIKLVMTKWFQYFN